MADLATRVHNATNRLAKWRTFFAAWEYGTQLTSHGPTKATKNHHERTIMLRAEVNAFTGLLIAKGVFTAEEFNEQIVEECDALNEMFEKQYPGIKAHQSGLDYRLPDALETMKKLGFPE